MHLYSPTQITLWRNCPRAWAFRYLSGLKSLQGPAAALGTEVDDTQLQPWLREGRPLDFTRESGYIAAAGLALLPEPKTHDLQVQVHFEIPSPTPHVDFGYQGYVDLWLPHGGMPGIDGTRPVVCDFKTTGNWKYAKTPSDLAADPQAMLYATAAMYKTGEREVDLAWVYFSTKGPRKAKRVHLRVAADHVAGQFSQLNATALEIDDVRHARPDPMSLPPNPNHCGAFGGCPHVTTCNLSPSETIDANLARFRANQKEPDMNNTMTLLEQLKADRAKALGVTQVGAAVVPAPPPAATSAPITPYWDTPEFKDAALAKARTKALVDAADDGLGLGINPPESLLPPAPPVGSVVVPEAAASTATPVEEKAKRGRPRGSAKDSAPVTNVTDVVGESLEMLESISVTWAKEVYAPIPYNTFEIGPFEATGYVRRGETVAQAHARIYAELVTFAEAARTAKAISNKAFLAAIGNSR